MNTGILTRFFIVLSTFCTGTQGAQDTLPGAVCGMV